MNNKLIKKASLPFTPKLPGFVLSRTTEALFRVPTRASLRNHELPLPLALLLCAVANFLNLRRLSVLQNNNYKFQAIMYCVFKEALVIWGSIQHMRQEAALIGGGGGADKGKRPGGLRLNLNRVWWHACVCVPLGRHKRTPALAMVTFATCPACRGNRFSFFTPVQHNIKIYFGKFYKQNIYFDFGLTTEQNKRISHK